MQFQKLKLLEDHIVVLKYLIGMISQELEKATEEKQDLLQKLGMAEQEESDTCSNEVLCSCSLCEESNLGNDVKGKLMDRSLSPDSPLDSLEGSDVAEAFYVEHDDDDTNDHDNGVHFSEDLPSPRDISCLEQSTDMNNALADSDDDEASTEANDPHNPVSIVTGDDDKMPRPTSSLNNADSDSDLEEEDSTKPQCWISNAVYTSNVIGMIAAQTEELESEFESTFMQSKGIADGFLSDQIEENTNVSLRSLDSVLMDKALAAARMASDLKRMKLELFDREAHIEFLYERYYSYKQALRKEVNRRQYETTQLKRKVDQTTSENFILFCKLQSAEARVAELESKLRSHSASDSLQNQSEKEEPLSDEVVNLDISAQRVARSNAQQHTIPFPYKQTETVVSHPLQESLSQTYAQLLKAEKRGDQLQRRLEKLEKQKEKPMSTTSLNTTSVKAKSKRPGTTQNKLRLDLSRVGSSMQDDSAPAKSAPRSKHGREPTIYRPRSPVRVTEIKRNKMASGNVAPKRWL